MYIKEKVLTSQQKQLDEFIQKKNNSKYFVFDPSTNTGYDMESIHDRNKLNLDFTKKNEI